MEQHLHLRYSVPPSTCHVQASGEATAKMCVMPLPVRFPPEDSRSMWSKFMLLAQTRKPGINNERVANVGLVLWLHSVQPEPCPPEGSTIRTLKP